MSTGPHDYCASRTSVKCTHFEVRCSGLFCGRWSCEHCAEENRRRLVARALAGSPLTFLTFTSPLGSPDEADAAARSQRDNYKRLRRRMVAEARRDPRKRPVPSGPPLDPKRAEAVGGVFPRQVRLTGDRLLTFNVFERTRNGWPHIHAFTDAVWINPHWLRQQWIELMGATQTKVKRVRSRRQAASYLAKYFGKCPEAFEGCKRYWTTPGWAAGPAWEPDPRFVGVEAVLDDRPWQVVAMEVELLGYREERRTRRSWTGTLSDPDQWRELVALSPSMRGSAAPEVVRGPAALIGHQGTPFCPSAVRGTAEWGPGRGPALRRPPEGAIGSCQQKRRLADARRLN